MDLSLCHRVSVVKPMPDAFEDMDRMYRLQRYFYDATRKYYLLGRDRLLNEMDIQPGQHVLEAGCGTARITRQPVSRISPPASAVPSHHAAAGMSSSVIGTPPG